MHVKLNCSIWIAHKAHLFVFMGYIWLILLADYQFYGHNIRITTVFIA